MRVSRIWTDEGRWYLAVILDLFSPSVVGWALDTTLPTKLPRAPLGLHRAWSGPPMKYLRPNFSKRLGGARLAKVGDARDPSIHVDARW